MQIYEDIQYVLGDFVVNPFGQLTLFGNYVLSTATANIRTPNSPESRVRDQIIHFLAEAKSGTDITRQKIEDLLKHRTLLCGQWLRSLAIHLQDLVLECQPRNAEMLTLLHLYVALKVAFPAMPV